MSGIERLSILQWNARNTEYGWYVLIFGIEIIIRGVIMEEKSIVRRAYAEYRSGNYSAAVDLYRQAGALLGEKHFRSNIHLCQKHLRLSLGCFDTNTISLESLKVACVMDEFTFHSYAPECDLFQLSPENSLKELESFRPDILFIESAWQGKDGLWNRKIGSLSHELKDVLQWCRMHHVPRIFWNKEDPVHFETFLTTAKEFDIVFTTDIDCIARYKAMLAHDNVYLLPFACQPKIHNPIELYNRKDAFCFAGAYYVRYPERTRDLENYVAEFPRFRPLEIFDRNFGKTDTNYQFPPEYQPYIVGTLTFDEIDKAYKGYRYSINLNSIKQSQTMFARRVYELLGSNTITVSNFSRGVRLMFGDLVISSDSGKEIVQRLTLLEGESAEKYRLAGLRKVMLEHTYRHRLAYVASKAFMRSPGDFLPVVCCLARASTKAEGEHIIASFQRQRHEHKRLSLVASTNLLGQGWQLPADENIALLSDAEANNVLLADHLRNRECLAILDANDYYGPNYLLDLVIATQYTDRRVVGKVERYRWSSDSVARAEVGSAYHFGDRLAKRSSLTTTALWAPNQTIGALLNAEEHFWDNPGLAIDPFNYCQDASRTSDLSQMMARVDDLPFDSGISIDELVSVAERIPATPLDQSSLPKWRAPKLMEIFGNVCSSEVSFVSMFGELRIESRLQEGKHQYFLCKKRHCSVRCPGGWGNSNLSGLDSRTRRSIYAAIFWTQKKQKISHVIHTANRNHVLDKPDGARFLRLAWRVLGPGAATVRSLLWGHCNLEPAQLLCRSQTLVLTNHYPSYDALYRNGFVHSRVAAYRARGVKVDVFRLQPAKALCYHEFHDVDVTTGSQEALHKMLTHGPYKSVLVHFLNESMWQVLQQYLDRVKVFVWVHGAEIQPWHRRDYNFKNEREREAAKAESGKRMHFWRNLLQPLPRNFQLIFVSRYFAEEVMEDLGFRLPETSYSIIHNPIDTDLFAYHSKPVEQRKKILSIRPYASAKYANDLSVKTIVELSRQPFFNDLEFHMIGDGPLFDEILEPLRHFKNVYIERRFLSQREIAELHQTYGVFLCPTRMDSQGVSRDEAMASGLVPITNHVTAIPEFVDATCGFAVPGEDWRAMAAAISRLYSEPAEFLRLSREASLRVRRQSATSELIGVELKLFSLK
ncbi:glycosyltransferase [Candidatus Accumulibacter phosphatis]|uniref:glycosyltransferase n=1 Tax=Candidatus Accumulibacter phosphatis TaxID=327160 RepID=UPI00145EE2B2|nr:glycosyltransferase [Candidatus Accumulibacter phosphatis]